MSKKYADRKQQRENRRKKRIALAKERQLESKNEFGIMDPTPKAAISNIINQNK